MMENSGHNKLEPLRCVEEGQGSSPFDFAQGQNDNNSTLGIYGGAR